MREHYIFNPVNDPDAIKLTDRVSIIIKDYYCEVIIEMPYDFCCYFVSYLIPKDDYSFYVCTYWEDSLDFMLDASNDTHWIVTNTWPLLYSLILNGSKDKYSDGAMIRLNNYDNGNVEWFLSTVITGEDIVSAIKSDDFIDKILFIKDLTIRLSDELQKEPDKKKIALHGIKEGAKEATRDYASKLVENSIKNLIERLFKG